MTRNVRDAQALENGSVRSFEVLGLAVGIAAASIGALVLIGGWAFDIAPLKSVLPGLSTMKANTALGIAALGASLAWRVRRRRAGLLVRLPAAVALAVGLLTLAEYVFHWNAGLDELLFRDAATPSAAFPGRPAIATALMIALLAIALLSGRSPAARHVKTTAALGSSLIAWAALSGYVFGPDALQEVPEFSSVALHSAAVLVLIGIGTLAAEPISWPLRTIIAKNTGGTVCRWLFPPALLAPPILGWFLSHEALMSSYPSEFRWALYSVASSLGSMWLILVLAHRIALVDAERGRATEMSLHDPLTGLANRRAFDSFLLEAFNLAMRHHRPLSLALLDIDRFKTYNDDYGHPAGDKLLRSLGLILSEVARETDLVARIGGEEFAIVLPETELAGARVIAERVRSEVERSSFFRRVVTVSVGVAALTERTGDISMLVDACDRALYRAKSAGRNRVSALDESELSCVE